MAVTWTIANLERNADDDGITVVHWRASDSEVVGEVTHSGSAYGTCGFSPNVNASSHIPYEQVSEQAVVQWVKNSLGTEAVAALESGIASQIEESKAPASLSGVPW